MLKLGWKITGLSSFLMLSLPYFAVAASSDSESGDLSSGVPKMDMSYVGQIIWVFVALGIVIALLVVTIKFLSKRNAIWSKQKGMRSLGGISLGQHSSMQVIEIGDRIYFLGVGNEVTLLDKEDDPIKVEKIIELLEQNEQSSMNITTIKDWLNRLNRSKREASSQNDSNMWNESKSFEDLLLSKLDKQAERKQELESLLKDKNK